MEAEEIIKIEAIEFCRNYLQRITHLENLVDNLKSELSKFYFPDYKAIFLDTVLGLTVTKLQEHRLHSHQGLPDPTCRTDMILEKFIFYTRQEISILPQIAHVIKVERPKFSRDKIFISYCHSDKAWIERMKRHFVPFRDKLDIWDDSRLQAGQKWKVEIEKAINQTKVAILFISADFFASRFIAENELPPLLLAAEQDGAAILSVIVKPCIFEEFPAINQYQAMNDPKKSLITMEEYEQEELWTNVVRQTKRILAP